VDAPSFMWLLSPDSPPLCARLHLAPIASTYAGCLVSLEVWVVCSLPLLCWRVRHASPLRHLPLKRPVWVVLHNDTL
jgi:hypothetical protein